MKNLEREDIYNIAKTITKEIVSITENPDEIKFLMDKVQSLVQDEVSFGEIENIIELVKKIKSTSKVEFQPIVELYIDRIIKLKNVKIAQHRVKFFVYFLVKSSSSPSIDFANFWITVSF